MRSSDLIQPRQWLVTNGATGTPKRLSRFADPSDYDTIDASGAVVVATLFIDHQLQTGDEIKLSGFTPEAMNGRKKITVISSTSFSFQLDQAPSQAIGFGAGVMDFMFAFGSATILAKKAARTANTGDVFLGTTSGDGEQPIQIKPYDASTNAGIYVMGDSLAERWNLYHWYLDVATAGDGVLLIMK